MSSRDTVVAGKQERDRLDGLLSYYYDTLYF